MQEEYNQYEKNYDLQNTVDSLRLYAAETW